jgi:hypothetical protein|tara:strand:+ start:143 stop:967 length:825 start_codon:yes stop_codon:yes gene_type:complete
MVTVTLRCTVERNIAREELRRIQEESTVALLSFKENERHLRTQLSTALSGHENGSIDGTEQKTKGPTIHSINDAAATTKHAASKAQPLPGGHHTHSAGAAKYTLHVLDYDGVVRGLNTLRVPKEASTREEKIRLYYENQLRVRDAQIGNADAVATKFHDKFRVAMHKLQHVTRSTQRHERSVRDGNERVKRAKEELQATREAMAAQSAMLTQRVMELEETQTEACELVDRLQNNEVRCVHCHGWNRIGRIVSADDGEIKNCIHCQKNSGFRSLT